MTPNFRKNVVFLKNRGPTTAMFSNFAVKAAAINFFINIHRFYPKNIVCFIVFVAGFRVLLINMVTLTIHRNLHIKTHFFIFRFLSFLVGNMTEILRQNRYPKKWLKMISRGPLCDPKMTPKDTRSAPKSPQNSKIAIF